MLFYLLSTWLQGRHYAYENTLFRGVIALIFCFCLVWIAAPRVIRGLAKAKMGDQPEFDNMPLNQLMADKKNVPTMGGILIVFAILMATTLFSDLRNFYVWMGVVCVVWLGTLGIIDDRLKIIAKQKGSSRHGLRWHEKLLFQIGLSVILASFILSYGKAQSDLVDPGETFPAYRVLSVPFYKHGVLLGVPMFTIITVIVTAGTSNAVNLTDGLDGLASGCVVLCGVPFMALSHIVGDPQMSAKLLFPHIPMSGELAVLCGSIVGSCLGFLWYNCNPARVFMGDAGALPLGGAIGYVAIVTRQELMLLVVGGVFVIELVSVILQVGYFKLTGGKRLFRVAPIHHHFQMTGWSETQTVVRFWLLGALFAALALATIKLR